SNDQVALSVPSSDPGGASLSAERHSFQRFYMPYVRIPDARTRIEVTPFYGFDHDHTSTLFGGVPASLDSDAVRYGVRAELAPRYGEVFALDSGVDVEGVRTSLARAGSLTTPPREGDVTVFGEPPGTDVNADRWQTHILGVAPYLRGRITLGPVSVEPGV